MNRYGKCIKCGGELEYQEPLTILTTYPPQIALICKECGHVEYKRIEQLTAEQVEKIEHEKLLQRVAELEKKVAKLLPTREQIGYDKKMWSEQELEKLILKILKKVSEQYEKEVIKRLNKEWIGEEE